jgi:hypothetical protein
VANITIGYGNLVDSATLTGGSWEASLPLSNLKDSRLALVARTTAATTTAGTISIDLGTEKRIRAIGLVNHNLNTAATIRVLAGTTSGFTSATYNSGAVLAWPSGTTSEEMTYARPTWALALDSTARYWRIEITNNSNPAGFLQVGRLFISGGFVPSINYATSAVLNYETDTSFEKSLGGAEFASIRPLRRVMRFSFAALPHAEAFGSALEITRQSATHREVLIIPDSADTANLHRRNFMGRLRQLSPVEQPFSLYGSTGYEVSELL